MKQKLGWDGEKKKFFLWIIIKSGGKRKIFIFTSLLILRELAMRCYWRLHGRSVLLS